MGWCRRWGIRSMNFLPALFEPRSGIRPLTSVPTERLATHCRAGGRFDLASYFTLNLLRSRSLFPARRLRGRDVRDAGLKISPEPRSKQQQRRQRRGGESTLKSLISLYGRTRRACHDDPALITTPPEVTSRRSRPEGTGWTVVSACARARTPSVRRFTCCATGVALAGGTEALSRSAASRLGKLRVLSTDTCRPFSRRGRLGARRKCRHVGAGDPRQRPPPRRAPPSSSDR